MALILPTPTELAGHVDGLDEAEALVWAADVFTLATGIKDTPADPFEARLIKRAILDMAWYLQTSHEDKEAVFSPFASERIGSYSYSKMQQAVKDGDPTGVSAFDQAVEYFLDKNVGGEGSQIQAASEHVFASPLSKYEDEKFGDPAKWNPDSPGWVF